MSTGSENSTFSLTTNRKTNKTKVSHKPFMASWIKPHSGQNVLAKMLAMYLFLWPSLALASAYIDTIDGHSGSNGEHEVNIVFRGNTKYYVFLQEKVNGSWTTRGQKTGAPYTENYRIPVDGGLHVFRLRSCDRVTNGAAGNCVLSGEANYTLTLPFQFNLPAHDADGTFTVSFSGAPRNYNTLQEQVNGNWQNITSISGHSGSTTVSKNNGRHHYRIKSCYYGSTCLVQSSASIIVTKTPSAMGSVITKPSPLTCSQGFNIKWEAANNANQYQVEEWKRFPYNGTWEKITQNVTAGRTWPNAQPTQELGYHYKYTVRPRFTLGGYTSGNGSATTTEVYRPTHCAPLMNVGTPSGNGKITVSWGAVSGNPGHYTFGRSGPGSHTITEGSGSDTYRKLSGLANGEHQFSVSACTTSSSYLCGPLSNKAVFIVAHAPGTPSFKSLPALIDQSYLTIGYNAASGSVSFYDLDVRPVGGAWSNVYQGNSTANRMVSGLGLGDWQFRLRACKTVSSYTNCSAFVTSSTLTIKPGVPSSLSVSDGSTPHDGIVELAWLAPDTGSRYTSPVPNMHYEIRQTLGSTQQHASTSATVWQSSALADGDYSFNVRGCSGSDCGNWSAAKSFTVTRKPNKANLSSISDGSTSADGSYTLKWTVQTWANNYKISQSGTHSTTYSVLGSSNTGTQSWTTPSARGDGNYSYRINACNGNVCAGNGSAKSIVVVNKPAKPQFSNLPTSSIQASFPLSWSSGAGNTGSAYRFVLEKIKTGETSWSEIYSGTSTSTTATSLSVGRYTFRLKNCKTLSGFTHCSPWTTTPPVTFRAPSAVSQLKGPSVNKNGFFILAWDTVAHASEYRVEEYSSANGWAQIAASGKTTLSRNKNQGNYKYRMRACNGLACSAYSTELHTRVLAKIQTEIPDAVLVNPTVPTSDIVGALPGQLTISGGAASYRVPISVPPGRNGMQPLVSLNYNSQSGEGLAGYGWSLSVGSSISRCASSVELDGYVRSVQLDNRDKLCLDGQRLILIEGSGQYGATGSEYYTEKYSGQKITLINSIAASNSHFEVSMNNNHKRYYGSASDARFILGGKTLPLRWHIKKAEDSHNNSIIYDYSKLQNEHKLRDIWYTGTGDSKGNRQIHFDYIEGERSHVKYLRGGGYRSGKILNKIQILIDGEETDHFQLAYDSHSPKRLERLSHCVDSDCLYTDFEWYEPTNTLSANNDIYWGPVSNRPWSTGLLELNITGNKDLNGDGIFDLIKNRQVFLSSPEKRYPKTESDWIDLPLGVDDSELIRFTNTFRGGLDANGDGKNDVIYVNKNGELTLALWDTDSNAIDTVSTGITVSCFMNNSWAPLFSPPKCGSTLEDFDGDGIKDLFLAETNLGTYTAIHVLYKGCILDTEDCTTGFIKQDVELSLRRGHFSPIDLNNDGYLDLVSSRITDNLHWYKTVVSDGRIQMLQQSVELELTQSRNNDGRNTVFWTDANRDGLQDLLLLDTPDDVHYFWYYITNLGDGRFAKKVNTGEPEFLRYEDTKGNKYPTRNGLALNQYSRQIDYNHDGVMDILVPGRADKDRTLGATARANCTAHNGEPCGLDRPSEGDNSAYDQFFYWKVVLIKENQGQFSFEHVELPGFKAQGSNIFLEDVDGDGFQDLSAYIGLERSWFLGQIDYTSDAEWAEVNRVTAYKHYEYTGGMQPGFYTWTRDHHNGNLLKSITTFNGRNKTAELSYKPLSFDHDDGSKIYTPTDDAVAFPYTKFTNTMKVVAKIDRDNGIGGTNSTRYYFEKGIFHKQGRGFQGFGKITEEDLTRGVAIENNFYQHFPYTGMVSHRQNRATADDHLLKEYKVLQVESDIGLGDKVVFPHVKESEVSRYRLSDSERVSSTNTLLGYDSKANLTEKIIETDDDTLTHTLTLKQTFSVNDDCVNLLKSATQKAEVSYKAYAGSTTATADTMEKSTSVSAWEKCQPRTQLQTASDSDPDTASSAASLQVDSTFDSYGNTLTLTTRGGSGPAKITARTATTEYESEGYFAENMKNAQWNDTAYSTQKVNKRFGGVDLATDANGLSRVHHYSPFGRLEQLSYSSTEDGNTPDSYTVTQWCDSSCPANALIKIINLQAGAPESTRYIDSLGRAVLSEIEGFDGTLVQSSKSYNNAGYMTAEYLPHYEGNTAATLSYSDFDVLGRPGSKTTDSAPGYYTATYTYEGIDTRVDIRSDEGSFSVARTYNALGQLVMTEDAERQRGYFRYDGFGNTTAIIDVAGNTIRAGYDGHGNKQWFDDPNMGRWQFQHNALGELRQQTDANQTVTDFVYDQLGRLTRQNRGSESTTFHYDPAGHYGVLDYETRNNGFRRDYLYDAMQRTLSVDTRIDGETFEVHTAYDGNYNRVKGEQYPGGHAVAMEYNSLGYANKALRVSDGSTLREIHRLSAQGEIVRQRFGNGLIQHVNRHTSGAVDSTCAFSYVQVNCNQNGAQYINYGYDSLGNLTAQNNQLLSLSYDYEYDNLQRLDDATLTRADSSTTWIDYNYDGKGNFTEKSDYASRYVYGNSSRSAGGNAGPNAVRQITKLNNALIHYVYDNNGNLLSGDGRSIAYNGNNKPTEIIRGNVTATFRYGADEHRFKQVIQDGSTTTEILYVDKVFEKRIVKNGNTVTSDIEKTYIGNYALITEAITGTDDSPTLSYLLGDRQGSITAITDGDISLSDGYPVDALILQHRDHGPFGQVRDITGNNGLDSFFATTRSFTGHEQLPEVELIHMNGRAYDYQLGRFLSVDPFVQFPENTQSANPYSYILNNPLAGTDPSGYIATDDYGFWNFGLQPDKKENDNSDVESSGTESTESASRTSENVGSTVSENPYETAGSNRKPSTRTQQGYCHLEGGCTTIGYRNTISSATVTWSGTGPSLAPIGRMLSGLVKGFRVTPFGVLVAGMAGTTPMAGSDSTETRGLDGGAGEHSYSGGFPDPEDPNNKDENGKYTNIYNHAATPIARRQAVLRGDKWKTSGTGGLRTAKGRHDYVVINGETYLAPRGAGHINIARGRPVDYAGEVRFSDSGRVTSWNNNSGHYRPLATDAGRAPFSLDKFTAVK